MNQAEVDHMTPKSKEEQTIIAIYRFFQKKKI